MGPRSVVHLGPVESRGGMSGVIAALVAKPPDGWVASSIPTHSEGGAFRKLSAYFRARQALARMLRQGSIDLAHFHVTHSMSWWRKRSLMRACERNGVPSIVHIHSGRFDDFCSGIAGNSVRRTLSKESRRTVVLEQRWLRLLAQWVPEDAVVIPNTTEPLADRSGHRTGDEVRLLVMSRDSRGKGHVFATRVLEALQERGVVARLVMTGRSSPPRSTADEGSIEALGWVDSDRRGELISWADFLLMPSEFEGSSLSVIEAMACGLPCLVSPASEETVGVESLILPIDVPGEWAKRIDFLRVPDTYGKVVTSVLAQADRFSPNRARSKLGDLYEELVGPSNDSH